MTVTIKLKDSLSSAEEQWLAKTIGPRLHYIHNSIGGEGWIAKRVFEPGMVSVSWTLTLEDDRYASWFLLKFPQ